MKKNNLILIPARSGSTRVKNKNIKKIGGKPLIYYIIRACVLSKKARVVVSTNSKKICKLAKKFGAEVPFLRPERISNSKSSSISCLIHALKWFKDNENWEPDNIAFCPPTNPFIKKDTVKKMFNLFEKNKKFNSIVSIFNSANHPFNFIKIKNKFLQFGTYKINKHSWFDFERTQEWPNAYCNSPAVRITKVKYFKKFYNDNLIRIINKTFDTNKCMGFFISDIEAFDINKNSDLVIANNLIKSIK